MRILVTGANGLIGSQIVTSLRAAGHQIVCAIRNEHLLQEQFADCEIITCDFNTDITSSHWEPRLKNIDVVINCVGILRQQHNQSIAAIHLLAPRALFDACCKTGVKKIIHISALGADPDAGTAYADTKYAAENYLMQLNIDWVILRPSLVYCEGSYGGTSLFRALAALPWVIPVLGDGQQYFQPIHLDDLTEVVKRLVENPDKIQKKIDVVGSERVALVQILIALRSWLNFSKAKILYLPINFVNILIKIGRMLGINTLNTTVLKMLLHGNTTSEKNYQDLIQTIGFTPRGFTQGLKAKPSHVQDRWHARLYFLKPLLRMALAILWIGSGVISLIPSHALALQWFNKMGFSSGVAQIGLYSTAILDIGLGLLLLLNWWTKTVVLLQFSVIIIYTFIASIFFPGLWLQPFAPLLKNIPILVATLIMFAIAEDR